MDTLATQSQMISKASTMDTLPTQSQMISKASTMDTLPTQSQMPGAKPVQWTLFQHSLKCLEQSLYIGHSSNTVLNAWGKASTGKHSGI
jgi:hypothetical protein